MAAYTDTFNRADASPPGAPWITEGCVNGDMQIVTNRIQALSTVSAALRGGLMKYDATWDNDQESEVTASSFLDIVSGGPACRIESVGSNDLTGCYALLYNGVDLKLWKLGPTYDLNAASAPTGTQLGSTVVQVVAATDKLRVRAVGTTITAYYNDALIITVTDSAHTTGKAGIIAHGSLSVGTSAAYWDAWAGADGVDVRPLVVAGGAYQLLGPRGGIARLLRRF